MVSLVNFSKLVGAVLVAGAIAAPIGCTIESTNNTPQYKYPSLTEFCTAEAAAECNDNVVNACYNTVNDADRGKCQSAVSATCNATTLPYHPEKAEDCIAAITGAWADAAIDHNEEKSIDAACVKVFNRAQPAASTCQASSDCDALNGLSCIIKNGTSGSCGVPKNVAPGDSCSDASAVCDDTHYCDSGHHCVSSGMAGDSCSATAPCAPAFNCTGTMSASSCTARGTDGDACKADTDCVGYCIVPIGTMTGKCSATNKLNFATTNCDQFSPQ